MKMGIKEMNFIHSLVGKRLLNVCCAAEILTFDFFPLALHASGYARIIKNSDILVTTLDYQSREIIFYVVERLKALCHNGFNTCYP